MDRLYDDGSASKDDDSKSSITPFNSISSHDGVNGAISSSSESTSSDDDSAGRTFYRSRPLNHEEIKNHLKGNLSFGLPNKDRSECLPLKIEKGSSRANILTHQLTQPKIDYIAKEIESLSAFNDQKEDIKVAYRLVRELMAASLHNINAPFMSENSLKKNADFLEINPNPLWLSKIRENIINNEYKTIAEVVRDLRVMIQSAYIFYGPANSTTKKALHLEFNLEQKLATLPEDLKNSCSLEKTNGITMNEGDIMQTKSSRICVKGDVYFSRLLYSVKGCKLARENLVKLKKIEARKKAKEEKEMVFVRWEQQLFDASICSQISAMWELAQIGQFLVLSLSALNVHEISQYEVERMLFTPEYSSVLKMLMTSLVSSPSQRLKISEKPYMPYKVWANKLASKVQQWYKIYKRENSNAAKVSEQLGIDPQFWSVCGKEWPFKHALFHELEFYKRVWLLKSLCDFVAHSHKTVYETIMEQPEDNMRERILGRDNDENEYIYLPQFINYNIRIYKRIPCILEEGHMHKKLDDAIIALNKSKSNAFSKEQIKYYKAVLRNSKRKLRNEDVWEYRTVKKIKQSRSRPPPTPLSSPATPRTRPGNLRQRPTPRILNEPVLDLVHSSDEDIEKDILMRGSNSPPIDNLSRQQAPNKAGPSRKESRKKFSCTVCHKVFSFVAALNGHMSVHSKKKKSMDVETGWQLPQNEPCCDLPVALKDEQMNINSRDGDDILREEDQDEIRRSDHEDEKSLHEYQADVAETMQQEDNLGGENLTDIEGNSRKNGESVKRQQNEVEDPHIDKKYGNEHVEASHAEMFRDHHSVSPSTTEVYETMQKSEPEVNDSKNPLCISTRCIKEEECVAIRSISSIDASDCKKEANLDAVAVDSTMEIKAKMELTETLKFEEADIKIENLAHKNINAIEDSLPYKKEIKLESMDNSERVLTEDFMSEEAAKDKRENFEDSQDEQPLAASSNACDQETTTSNTIDLSKNSTDFVIGRTGCDIGIDTDAKQKTEQSVWQFCDPKLFHLVVSTVEDLRQLIKKFGPVPAKLTKEPKEEEKSEHGVNDDDDSEDEVAEVDNEDDASDIKKDLTDCERSLYDKLCELLADYSPYESKLKSLQKQVVKKMYKEQTELKARIETYGDPDEEAWKSELEPEPMPETPTVSSSSSSSADEYYDDGARKRKLRKRKGRSVKTVSQATSCEQTPVPSPTIDKEITAISSRGRVRKVRKIVNYDKLDFEKLAEEAKNEAYIEREKKKRRRDIPSEEPKFDDVLKIPSAKVQKYVMSKTGEVIGYIDTEGHTHYCKKEDRMRSKVGTSSAPANKMPVLSVAAKTEDGKEIMVRVVGTQATTFLDKVEKAGRSSRTITVLHNEKKYIFPLNSKFHTRNIPGYPDCDMPLTPPKEVAPRLQTNAKPRLVSNSAEDGGANSQAIFPLRKGNVNGSTTQTEIPSSPIGEQSNVCKRVMFKTAKGPMRVNVSTTLASLLQQNTTNKITTVSNSSVGSCTASTSSISNNYVPKLTNAIKIYKSPPPSNILGTASTSGDGRYIVLNHPSNPLQTVQTQQTNNFMQINNTNTNQYIQIQPNLIQYTSPTNSVQSNIVQLLPQTTSSLNQPTFVPVATAAIPQPSTFLQAAPLYNQVLLQSPIPSQSVLLPQVVQQIPPIQAVAGTTRTNSKIFIIQTNEGRKVCLQTTDGKLVMLTNEQIQVLVNRGAIKSNPT